MLDLLHIENIAIIERADIAFQPGFNALTGETGAGKSIVIDAMSAVLDANVTTIIAAVVLLFYAVARWNEWLPATMFLRSRELYPLQLFLREILLTSSADAIVNTGGEATNVTALAEIIKYATIVVSTLPILVVYPFVQKYFVSGVMIGGVKE